MPLRKARHWVTSASMIALFAGSPAVYAQEVVQALPPPGSQELSNALQRLASNGNDVAALLDAGDAAITLGDVAAAIGFFGRAQALTPSNPRISLGLARAYTLSRRPVEALRLYAEAEKGGIPLQNMAADRALAFDLVGDAKSAQELYRMALAGGAGDAVRRHLAVSQAISGDKAGFEATLLPLLEQGDNAAFRTRAFGLAILGETDAAIKIARTMMPGPMASRVEPYLKHMTKLTPAQQAAAGMLGVFPRTAAIGQDDAQIAGYTPSARSQTQASAADASLAPSGPTLGSQLANNTRSSRRERRQERRERREAAQTSAAPTLAAPAARSEELPSVNGTTELPSVQQGAAAQPVDMGAQPTQSATQTPPPPAPPPPREKLEDAFANFELAANGSTAPRAGAVDIRAIDVPRERNEPPPPPIPQRHWVQVATGRDLSALGFDWRRISRNAQGELAGKSAFTAPWGEANRLLAGPFDSVRETREVVSRLKAIGVDSFPFTSERGEEVFPLSGAGPAPEAVAPSHPSRNWVQIATGRDRNALGFDWRRISRNADGALNGKGPFVVTWGEANRLLAGPYDSPAEAREMVNRLKAKGIDSFTFTSEDGEAIEKLD